MTAGPHTESSEGPPLGSKDWMSDEVAQAFAEEARSYLDEASTLLRELEGDIAERAPLRRLWQIVHTLKGTAGILGQEAVSGLAHRMEDLLKALDDNTVALDRQSLALLFVTVETLEDMIFEGGSPPELLATLATYDQLLNLAPAAMISTTLPSDATVPSAGMISTTLPSDAESGAPTLAPGVESLRVPLTRLDGLARLASEISIQRSAFDLRVSDMNRLFGELNQGVTRLARVSQSLLDEYRADRADLVTHDAHSEFDALEMDRYTEIDVLSQALNEAAGDVETAEGDLRAALRGLEGFRDGYAQLTSELQDRLLDVRMVPFASLSARLHRTIRVTARQQAKRVALTLEGENVEIDKSVIEEVAEPLLHLMRNAIDHGIETPDRRRAAGKIEQGEIQIGVIQEGADVIIRVVDDGAGLDFDRIRQQAVETGLFKPGDAEEASDEALGSVIFRPGFSTARAISHISGRGVGLDAVRETVRRLRGRVEVRSARGQGTTFEIRLPRNLTLTQSLLVRAGGESLAIPLSSVDHVRYVEQTDFEGSEDHPTTSIDGESLPLLDLAAALGLESVESASDRAASDRAQQERFPALVLRAEGRRLVVLIERILRVEELVVESAEKLLRRSIPGLSGAALRGDGRVVLVVHPDDLARGRSELPAPPAVSVEQKAPRGQIDVLIVDDSLTVRKVLSQLIEAAGWKATTARDGVDAWEQLETGQVQPDVVVLDLEMPRMDGFELTTLLRAHQVWRQVPVLILTSRAAQKHRQKAFDLGVDEYLVKPYREEEIVATVRRLISADRISADRVSAT